MSRHKSLLARFGKQRRHPVRTMTARLEQLEPRIVLAGEPFAVNDVYIIPPNTTLAVDANAGLLINDRDPDQPSFRTGLTVATEWVTPPQVGSLNAYAADGSFEYQPAQDFVGLDTFTYKNTDERQNLTIPPPIISHHSYPLRHSAHENPGSPIHILRSRGSSCSDASQYSDRIHRMFASP